MWGERRTVTRCRGSAGYWATADDEKPLDGRLDLRGRRVLRLLLRQGAVEVEAHQPGRPRGRSGPDRRSGMKLRNRFRLMRTSLLCEDEYRVRRHGHANQ